MKTQPPRDSVCFHILLPVLLACIVSCRSAPVGMVPEKPPLAGTAIALPEKIIYERFEQHHVFLKKAGYYEIEGRRLVAYQVQKVTSTDGLIYKKPGKLAMYVDPADRKVKYFRKDTGEPGAIAQLVNPTVDSFGLEQALGVPVNADLPDQGSFRLQDGKRVYFQRVGSTTIDGKEFQGFAIVKAVDIEGQPFLLSDILTLYVDPHTLQTEYFSQLCNPCNDKPRHLLSETEFTRRLREAIDKWRDRHENAG